MSGFTSGLAQIIAPTNLLALLALGLMLGQNATRLPGISLAAFAFGLFTGSILIARAIGEMDTPLAALALAAGAGIAVAIARPLPRMIAGALSFATGAVLALNSPPQATTIPAAIVAQLATGIAALAAVSLVAFVAAMAGRAWQRIGNPHSGLMDRRQRDSRAGAAACPVAGWWNLNLVQGLVECTKTSMVHSTIQLFPDTAKTSHGP